MSLTDQGHGAPDLSGLPASRRDFLKLAGFSIAAAMLPGCGRGAEHEAVPFLSKPEGVTPGQSNYYATGCQGCEAGCGLLVKVRDGRPIKIEGNDSHPLSRGRTCAVGQAGILGLYDSHRLTRPVAQGQPSDWASVDAAIGAELAKANGVRVLTGTLNGPTTLRAIDRFVSKFGDGKHVMLDALSHAALLDAHEALYGIRAVPRYRFEHALAVVSVDADFLGTWLSPLEFARGYHAARSLAPKSTFCNHTHFEARVSLTGGCADRRVRVAPSELPLVLAALAERVAADRGTTTPWGQAPACRVDPRLLDATARRLLDAERGRALVVCGLNDEVAQRITAYVNHLLGADDPSKRARTVDLVRPSLQARGSDRSFGALRREIDAGRVGALVIAGCNPVYDLPDGAAFAQSLKKVGTVIRVAERMDETAAASNFVCPPPHHLASWGDAEPVRDLLTLSQPTIAPLGDTRALVESLATWGGAPSSAYDQMRATWKQTLYPRALSGSTFEQWWHQALHDGHVRLRARGRDVPAFKRTAVPAPAAAKGGLSVVLYPKVALRDGRHAHNPWLQELPDPVTKVSWQNTADIGPKTAEGLEVVDGDIVRVTVGKESVELPVLVQEGQAEDVIAIALGYGVAGTERFTNVGPDWIQATPTVEPGGTVGVRAAGLATAGTVSVEKTGQRSALARTQIYSRLDVPKHLAPKGGETRPFVQETTWNEYRLDPGAGAPHHAHPQAELWAQDHPYKGHHWQLAIDLASCTGCAACVVACQSENNIPVVGKDEMTRQREMHWLRIDRYFQGEDDDLRIAHQPMMCQQCDHAPCETVCPVLATVHGEEGLNQQVYNRCVGTRYCSNNCPYKVRRFNWFDYARDDTLQNLSLNPDVTVRSRGVMEKCSFCVQRIQEAKAVAARDGRRPLRRDEIQTACMQVCPVDAIVFGDGNDPGSKVAKLARSKRAYRALEELNVKPSVSYLRSVKDRPAQKGEHHE